MRKLRWNDEGVVIIPERENCLCLGKYSDGVLVLCFREGGWWRVFFVMKGVDYPMFKEKTLRKVYNRMDLHHSIIATEEMNKRLGGVFANCYNRYLEYKRWLVNESDKQWKKAIGD